MKKILAMLLVCGACVFGPMTAQAQTADGAQTSTPAVASQMAAQVAPQNGASASPQSARLQRMAEQLQGRFAAANTTHDGKLTQAQALAGMPMVAKHFDEIDVNKAGYVTLAQIETYMQQHAAGR
ncbi:MAG TPA: EF-hand domain-containing protein [Pararobbsia sp.]|nr:EF-hand domain-containing protein [Pararobbsia sp.]